jgi:hypothetical protein
VSVVRFRPWAPLAFFRSFENDFHAAKSAKLLLASA